MSSGDVILEPVASHHFEEWSAILAPIKIAPASFKMFIDMTEHQLDNEIAFHYIVRNSDKEFIGSASVINIERGQFQRAILEYKILASQQNKNYETKVLSALENVGFNQLKLKKLMLYKDPQDQVPLDAGYQLEKNVFVKIRN